AAHPSWDLLVDRGGAQDLGPTVDSQHRSGSEFGEVPNEHARSELVNGASVMACVDWEIRLGVGHPGRVADPDCPRSEVDDSLGPLDDHVQVIGPSPCGQVLPSSVSADD